MRPLSPHTFSSAPNWRDNPNKYPAKAIYCVALLHMMLHNDSWILYQKLALNNSCSCRVWYAGVKPAFQKQWRLATSSHTMSINDESKTKIFYFPKLFWLYSSCFLVGEGQVVSEISLPMNSFHLICTDLRNDRTIPRYHGYHGKA